jgi:hypothetical protein
VDRDAHLAGGRHLCKVGYNDKNSTPFTIYAMTFFTSGNTFQSNELVTSASSSVSVTQAISWFNNRFLYDRRMTVRMDHEAVRDNARPPKLPEGLRSIGMGLRVDGNPLHDKARNLCCFCWQDIKTLFNRFDDARVTV